MNNHAMHHMATLSLPSTIKMRETSLQISSGANKRLLRYERPIRRRTRSDLSTSFYAASVLDPFQMTTYVAVTSHVPVCYLRFAPLFRREIGKTQTPRQQWRRVLPNQPVVAPMLLHLRAPRVVDSPDLPDVVLTALSQWARAVRVEVTRSLTTTKSIDELMS